VKKGEYTPEWVPESGTGAPASEVGPPPKQLHKDSIEEEEADEIDEIEATSSRRDGSMESIEDGSEEEDEFNSDGAPRASGPSTAGWPSCCLLAAGCWLLAGGCWLLAAGCSLLLAGCRLLLAGCCLPSPEADGSRLVSADEWHMLASDTTVEVPPAPSQTRARPLARHEPAPSQTLARH
jgi:hypothetical protein